MNGETNFCGYCGEYLFPADGEIRQAQDGKIEAVCETCIAVEQDGFVFIEPNIDEPPAE